MSATAGVPNSSESERRRLRSMSRNSCSRARPQKSDGQPRHSPRPGGIDFYVAGDWLVIIAAMMAARRIDALWAYAAATAVVGQIVGVSWC
jgi:hypothetical protein